MNPLSCSLPAKRGAWGAGETAASRYLSGTTRFKQRFPDSTVRTLAGLDFGVALVLAQLHVLTWYSALLSRHGFLIAFTPVLSLVI